MQMWTCFDGSKHPVSTAFVARMHPDLDGKPYDAVKAELDRLLALTGRDILDGGRDLTAAERVRIDALTHVFNLNRALAFMAGRDYREIFGPDGTLDQVHGNTFAPDTCGCILQKVFDHNRRDQPGLETHPHHAKAVCHDHRGLAKDYKAHHAAVMAECVLKNQVLTKHAQELGVPQTEIAWRFDGARRLIVAHPKIAPGSYKHEGKADYRAELAR